MSETGEDRFSVRGQRNLNNILPLFPPAIKEASEDSPGIDLAAAENWTVREEVRELCLEAVQNAFQNKHLSWPVGFYGSTALLDATVRFLNAQLRLSRPISSKEIVLSPGASGAVMAILSSICDEGDGVLVPAPYWIGFKVYAETRAGVKLINVVPKDMESAQTLSILDDLESAYTNAQMPVRALLISNPSNPLGRPWPQHVLEAMVQFCQAKGLHFISDEAFAGVHFQAADFNEAPPFTSALELDMDTMKCDAWRTHVAWSASKLFGLNGLRIGFGITRGGSEFRDAYALGSVQEVSNVSSLMMTHLLSSNGLEELVQLSRARLAEHYELLTALLTEYGIPYLPCNASLSIMAKLAPNATSWDEERQTIASLKQEGLIVGSGRMYCMPESEKGWARVTFAVERTNLEKGMKILATFFKERMGMDKDENGGSSRIGATTLDGPNL